MLLTIERTFKNSWVSNCNRILKRGYESSPKWAHKNRIIWDLHWQLLLHFKQKRRALLTFESVFSVLSRDAVEHLNNKSKTIIILRMRHNPSNIFTYMIGLKRHVNLASQVTWIRSEFSSSFPVRNIPLLRTDTCNVRGQISEHIFAPNGSYCLNNWKVTRVSVSFLSFQHLEVNNQNIQESLYGSGNPAMKLKYLYEFYMFSFTFSYWATISFK